MPSYIPGLGKNEDDARIGVLLANLGTPEAPTTGAVRRYLKEFLWDPRVVELSRPLWWFILNGVILNIRPAKSAKAYREVWTDEGSPLLVTSKKQQLRVQQALEKSHPGRFVVELGMRYGNPSLPDALARLAKSNARRLLVLPLYPQYSATTTASITDGLFDEFKRWRVMPELQVITQYYQTDDYIDALVSSISSYWGAHGRPDKLLFSFHSIPRRYTDAGDVYAQHCEDSAQRVAASLGLTDEQWQLSYQSRIGAEEWLRPYTDETLEQLGANRAGRVDVVCPGFSADCLETLEEIDQENRERYLSCGGTEFHYIPALNDGDDHINMMLGLIHRYTQHWS